MEDCTGLRIFTEIEYQREQKLNGFLDFPYDIDFFELILRGFGIINFVY